MHKQKGLLVLPFTQESLLEEGGRVLERQGNFADLFWQLKPGEVLLALLTRFADDEEIMPVLDTEEAFNSWTRAIDAGTHYLVNCFAFPTRLAKPRIQQL